MRLGRIAAAGAIVAAAGAAAYLAANRRPFIERPADPVTDFDRSEAAQSHLTAFLNDRLGRALRDRDPDRATAVLTEDFRGRVPGPAEGIEALEPGVLIREYRGEDAPVTDAAGFIRNLKEHLAAYAEVERSTFRCYEFLLEPGSRGRPEGGASLPFRARAVAAYHWQLAGRGADGRAIDLQGDLEGEFLRFGDEWRIRRIALPRAWRVDSSLPPFADVTDPTGFEFMYSAEGRRALQAAIDNRTMTNVGALAAVDWNRDGFVDFIATNENRRSVVFVNDGRGGFLPEALPEEGALFYLHLDLDGDGTEELVSTRPAWFRQGEAALGLYRRRDGRWELLPDALAFANPPGHRELLFHHVAAGDVDGDGDLDLFVCGYSNSESGRGGFNFMDARNGQRNLLFVNQGGLRFAEESEKRGIRGARYSYVAEFFDLDGDGDLDLHVVNDFGPNDLYWNRGDGTFDEEHGSPLVRGTTYSMGLAIADFDNTGDFAVYVSNMYSHAGNRIVPMAAYLREDVRTNLVFSVQGNTLFERRNGRWVETGVERGVNRADWAWGCVFFDADNDGDKDLYVVNGFTTHSDPAAPDY